MKKQSTSLRVGRTTKHLSALDFLLNIKMKNEAEIIKRGTSMLASAEEIEKAIPLDDDYDNRSVSSGGGGGGGKLPTSTGMEDQLVHALIGKKLQGPPCESSRVPADLRYRIMRMQEQNQNARLAKWEDLLLKSNAPLLQSRIMFSRVRGYPVAVCSIVTYNAGEEKARQERQSGADVKSLEIFAIPPRDWRGRSYKSLLKPWHEDIGSNAYLYERGLVHDPNYLDDPKMVHGSSRQESRGDVKRGPIIYSIIQFKNKKELKEQLNDQFRDRHPQLPPSLTFSKIRNLKKSLLLGCVALDIEVSTAAVAYVCFERLCLRGIVNKINRYLTMSVCLVLAYKFLEPLTGHMNHLEVVMSFIDREWEVSKKEVFEAEFGAFVQLGFLVQLPYQHIYLVYNKLLKQLHKTSRTYLGEEMSEIYTKDIRWLELLQKGRGDGEEEPVVEEDEDEEAPPETENEENETATPQAVLDEEAGELAAMEAEWSVREEAPKFENRRPFFKFGSLLGKAVSISDAPTADARAEGDKSEGGDSSSSAPILSMLGFGRRVSFLDHHPVSSISSSSVGSQQQIALPPGSSLATSSRSESSAGSSADVSTCNTPEEEPSLRIGSSI